ncbi:hypothetical protein BH11MYX4_BH11MYX4_11000 [soil metagenome]
MTSPIRRVCCAIGMAFALLFAPSIAHADTKGDAVEVGVVPALDFQLAPLEAPSAAHPWGTVALAWRAVDAALVDHLRIGEWDLRAGQLSRVRTLRDGGLSDGGIRLARAGDKLLILSSGLSAPGSATELIQLGLDFVEQGSVVFADGFLASLAVDGRFIAVGSYETGNYHVRLVDAATLAVVAARKFRGPLAPWPAQELSSHALRLEAGHLYLALAEPDPRFVRLRLPSLVTDGSTVFRIPQAHRSGYTSASLSAPPAALSFDSGNDRQLLASDLRILAPLPARTAPKEDEESSQMVGERVTQRIFGRTVSTSIRHERWMLRVTP